MGNQHESRIIYEHSSANVPYEVGIRLRGKNGSSTMEGAPYYLSDLSSISEGITVLSDYGCGRVAASQESESKCLVYHLSFSNEQQYEKFINTLFFRRKALSKCNRKAQLFFNSIRAIYVEKSKNCSCASSEIHKVYAVEDYYELQLRAVLAEAGGNEDRIRLRYKDLFSILVSLTKVMAIYQKKRLRYYIVPGSDAIYLTKGILQHPGHQNGPEQAVHSDESQSKQNTIKNSSASHIYHSIKKLEPQLNTNRLQDEVYYCVVSDTYMRYYHQKREFIGGSCLHPKQQQQPVHDVYKEDVYELAHQIEMYIRNNQHLEKGNLTQEEQHYENLVRSAQKYMQLNDISLRFNWLQLDRYLSSFKPPLSHDNYNYQRKYLQAHRNNRAMNVSQTPSSKYITGSYINDSQGFKRSSNAQSTSLSKDALTRAEHRSPFMIDSHRGYYPITMEQNNKENGSKFVHKSTNSVVTLGGAQGFQSKPFVFPSNNFKYLSVYPAEHLSKVTSSQNLQPQGQQNSPLVCRDKDFSGHGIVQNPCPVLLKPDDKVDFSNLFNINKGWTKFEGTFENGNKSGPGTIFLTNGSLYSGIFKDDLANGKGAVYRDGEILLKGTWKNNVLLTTL